MPASVKTNLVLSVFLAVLCWGFYAFFAINQPESPMVSGILATAIAYSALAPVIVFGVLKRHALAVRGGWALIFLASLYVPAPIGIVVSLVCAGLTFRVAAKDWFSAPAPAAAT